MPAGRRDQSGFTLLEVVVVLVIVGIITGFALLSVGTASNRDRVQEEGKRLAATLAHQRELAMLQFSERGLVLTESGYQILRLDGTGWATVPGGSRDLPEGLRLELRVDDLPASLKPAEESEDTPDEEGTETKVESPQLWILSTGEYLPFELSVVDVAEEHRYRIDGSAAGSLAITFESVVR